MVARIAMLNGWAKTSSDKAARECGARFGVQFDEREFPSHPTSGWPFVLVPRLWCAEALEVHLWICGAARVGRFWSGSGDYL
jgi:hypothetical protein